MILSLLLLLLPFAAAAALLFDLPRPWAIHSASVPTAAAVDVPPAAEQAIFKAGFTTSPTRIPRGRRPPFEIDTPPPDVKNHPPPSFEAHGKPPPDGKRPT